jgi:hypothetical protein
VVDEESRERTLSSGSIVGYSDYRNQVHLTVKAIALVTSGGEAELGGILKKRCGVSKAMLYWLL